ncbi:hypothetical protein O0L34_g3656 [Tuta absoluta]|nr:hypothetical protein O0L34_g3656 [Tuta absoluta]
MSGKDGRPVKRDARGKFKDKDADIEAWLEEAEEENEFSDFGDSVEDPDFQVENEQREISHENQEEQENIAESSESEDDEANQPLSLISRNIYSPTSSELHWQKWICLVKDKSSSYQ